MKGIKLPDTISEEELIKVLKITKKAHHRAAFALAFYECMRVSEVANLEKEDVRRETKLLYIRQAKGHKDRHQDAQRSRTRGKHHQSGEQTHP